MTSPLVSAEVIAASVAALAIVNIRNMVLGSRKTRGIERKTEISPPSSREVLFVLAGLSTLALGVLCGLYIVITFFGLEESYPIGLIQIPQSEPVQAVGVALFVVGSLLFTWSVIARGRYSVSWSMPIDQKLVTWGPYHYVRHPSYTGYFLMFTGIFLAWFNLLCLILFLGIPGYVRVSQREERMLS